MAGKGQQRTSLPIAATAAAMHESGVSVTDISGATGLPKRTIYKIINGDHQWAEILHNDDRFKLYRDEVKRQLQAGSLELSKKCLDQIEDRLCDSSAAQAAVVYGILFDKERLQAG